MPLKSKEAQALIEKYKKGLCTEKELYLLNQWFENLGKEKPDFGFGDETHELHIKNDIRWQIEEALQNREVSLVPQRKLLLRIAAMGLLFIGLGWAGWYLFNLSKAAKQPVFVEIITPVGTTQIITLPDGTTVYLNADTHLSFEKGFLGNTRQVKLEGEAFFEVARNPNKPFFIHTGKLTTQVLGTRFNVKAYQGEENIEVAVVSGKVNVNDSLSALDLLPNQKAVYRLSGRQLIRENIADAKTYKAWTEGNLIFEDKTLPEIISVLNRRYGVKISLSNPQLNNCTLNAQFNQEPLEKVLEKLCLYIGARYKKTGNQILLNGKGC